MSETVEVVVYKLKEGIEVQAFVKAAKQIEDWAASLPGFQFRALSLGDDGTWGEVYYWASREAAENAHGQFMAANGDSEFMKMIDPSTLSMSYGTIYMKRAAQ